MNMENICILLTYPVPEYLVQELEKRFRVFKFRDVASNPQLIGEISSSIRAIVGTSAWGADAGLIDALPKLEIVASYSVGFDKIDLVKCKERGITVTNTPDVLSDDVADCAVGLALATVRRICVCDRFVRRGKWKEGEFELTTKFSGKSVGIVGLGRIGSAIAKRAVAFGCTISYHSRSEKAESYYKYYPNIIDLAANCKILFVACALSKGTQHIVNRKVIDALGPKGIIVNIGRGALIDEPELVSALLEGRLAGAGLDVFEREPKVPEELLGLENVVLQPHAASDTVETSIAMSDLVIKNLEAHFQNKPVLTPVI